VRNPSFVFRDRATDVKQVGRELGVRYVLEGSVLSTRMAMTSQPRSLLSIAKLNIARSRVRPSIWSFVRINQTCLGRSGGFAPVSFPFGTRWAAF